MAFPSNADAPLMSAPKAKSRAKQAPPAAKDYLGLRKTTPQSDIAAVSGSGLIPADIAALSTALVELKPLNDRQHLLGGNERLRLLGVQQRIHARLHPTAPAVLIGEAQAIVAALRPTLDGHREEVRRRELEDAEIAKVRADHRQSVAAERAKRLDTAYFAAGPWALSQHGPYGELSSSAYGPSPFAVRPTRPWSYQWGKCSRAYWPRAR